MTGVACPRLGGTLCMFERYLMAVAEGAGDERGRDFEDQLADCSVACAEEVDSEVAEAVHHGVGWRCRPARVLGKSQTSTAEPAPAARTTPTPPGSSREPGST